VGPVVFAEARDAPQHAERFDGTGGYGAAHVGGFPAELVEDFYDGFSGGDLVAGVMAAI
jgi:hypothetical protein